jgi:hypothetical protein
MFKRVQEAFDRIKEDRGMKVRMGYRNEEGEDLNNFESVRPNASQYDDDFDDFESKYGDFDFNEYAYRQNNPEFDDTAGNFLTDF